MQKKFKIISFLPLASILMIVIGAIFGSVAAWKLMSSSGDNKVFYVFLTAIIIVSAVLIFSNFVAFNGIRKGQVKTAILGLARNSVLQFLGPITAAVLAIIGLAQSNAPSGMYVFVIATFVISFIATSMNMRSLKAYRKDKENYSYSSMIAFISAGTLFIFLIAALIGEFQIAAAGGGNHMVGYGITFTTMFILSDIVSFVALGLTSKFAQDAAPETTLADASANDIKQVLKETIQETNGVSNNSDNDNIAKIREYKKLLDEGIISQAEFDQKKKELLR